MPQGRRPAVRSVRAVCRIDGSAAKIHASRGSFRRMRRRSIQLSLTQDNPPNSRVPPTLRKPSEENALSRTLTNKHQETLDVVSPDLTCAVKVVDQRSEAIGRLGGERGRHTDLQIQPAGAGSSELRSRRHGLPGQVSLAQHGFKKTSLGGGNRSNDSAEYAEEEPALGEQMLGEGIDPDGDIHPDEEVVVIIGDHNLGPRVNHTLMTDAQLGNVDPMPFHARAYSNLSGAKVRTGIAPANANSRMAV